MRYIFLILITVCFASCNKKKGDNYNCDTDYFEFKNDYWVNLHHFLYQKADSSQLRKLKEDGFSFIDIGEADAFDKLSSNEKILFNEAVQYYRDSLTIKILRRELNGLRHWLQEKEESRILEDTLYGKKYTEVINRFSPVYEKYFWDLHKNHNTSILKKHIEIIDMIEGVVLGKMESFSLNKWPDSTKVRVDLTTYANYAGGYMTSRPELNIVISTLDPTNITTSFVETVLHEGSHLLYLYGESPIRDKIYYKSDEMGIRFPRNLWHANIMYLGGLATQEELSKLGIEHVLNMDEKNIFSNYTTSRFKESCKKHYNDEIDADSMIVEILSEMKEKLLTNDKLN